MRRTLRALRGAGIPDDAQGADSAGEALEGNAGSSADDSQPDTSSVDGLEDAVAALESKLESGAGIDGLASWLREVETTLNALTGADLDNTRDDIRGVIDRLLAINAEIQNVVRLKKLLS